MGSTRVRWQISLVAAFENGSFKPLTAEQMQADAISDGAVWIKVGSEKKNIIRDLWKIKF